MSDDLRVSRTLTIPAHELAVRFTPSGGPGGQHANKASTRVELRWNVETSAVLGPRQRARLRRRLASRLDAAGSLRVVSDAERSQHRNREEARGRLARIVREALRAPKRRVATRPSRAARERRLAEKRRRSQTKRRRARPSRDEG